MDDKYDDFEINDRDIQDALNLGKGGKKLSKEEQIYGIWMEKGDEKEVSKKFINFSKPAKKMGPKKIFKTKNEEKEQFAGWEKHTTAFGSKMLEKMGYKVGEGLGKKGSGITTPIQATLRPGKATLGAYGSEKTDIIKTSAESTAPLLVQPKKNEKVKIWRQKNKQQNFIKKTYEQLLKEAQTPEVESVGTSTKVVDMTGSQVKVSFGYNSISKPSTESTKPCVFAVPELSYNLHVLTMTTEKTLKTHLKRAKIKQDVLNSYKDQQASIEKTIKQVTEEKQKLTDIYKNISELKMQLETDKNAFEKFSTFLLYYSKFYEYQEENLDLEGLLGAIFYPILYDVLICWNCLVEPDLLIPHFKQLKMLLDNYSNDSLIDSNTLYANKLYDSVLFDLWLPHVYQTFTHWDLSNSDSVTYFVKIWAPLLTENALKQIKLIVFNAIRAQLEQNQELNFELVKAYEEILGKDIKMLYKPVVKLLMCKLQAWHPSSDFALELVTPVAKILSKNNVNAILARTVVPKLVECLETEFTVNPRNQDIRPLQWALKWKNLIDDKTLGLIIYRGFSIKWLSVLNQWLLQNPNYNDIKKWYSGWKSLFQEIINEPPINDTFNQALQMIDSSIKKLPIQPPQPYVPKPVSEPKINVPKISLSLKEIIQQQACDHGILFQPTLKHRPDGKTVYSFGSNLIYIDRNVIFCQQNSVYIPISLDDLVKLTVDI